MPQELTNKLNNEGKSKVHAIICHTGAEEEQSYSSTLSLTSALNEDGWLTLLPCCFTPAKRPVAHCTGGQVGPWPDWTGAEQQQQ